MLQTLGTEQANQRSHIQNILNSIDNSQKVLDYAQRALASQSAQDDLQVKLVMKAVALNSGDKNRLNQLTTYILCSNGAGFNTVWGSTLSSNYVFSKKKGNT